MRQIEAQSYFTPASDFAPGPAPMLQWIKVEDLVVDERYQRPIAGKGRISVNKIAADFSWSKFSPVIVSPVEGGKFAIVDGQHRTTAALIRAIDSVPCQVIIATQQEQAGAFSAINSMVTQMHQLALHRAAVAAGVQDEVEVSEIAAGAGVTILPYPVAMHMLKAGETVAIVALRNALRRYGRDTLITALNCFTETTNHKPGTLTRSAILAVCAVLDENHMWRDSGASLLEAFDGIDLELETEEARARPRARGVSTWKLLAEQIAATLSEVLTVEPAPVARATYVPNQSAA